MSWRIVKPERIRLTRSIFLAGKHADAGSVHELAKPLARDLVAQGSAVLLSTRWWLVFAACLALGVAAVVWWAMARGLWVTR